MERVREEGPRERWRALSERVEQLEPELLRLFDRGHHGRGRALFARVSGGAGRDGHAAGAAGRGRGAGPERLRAPAGERARPRRADRRGRRLEGEAIKLVDLRLGEATDAGHFAFTEDRQVDYQGGEFEGPGNNAGSARDEWADWISKARERFVHSMAPRIGEVAGTRGWQTIFVVGDARLTHPLAEELRKPNNGHIVVEQERMLEWRSPDEIARALAPELDELRLKRELAVVEHTRDATLGVGRGTLGLRDTLNALNDARVAHLVIDEARELVGASAPDGRLSLAGEPPLGVEAADLRDEPRLTERMIERALETSARVTPVSGPAAEVLAEHEGVASVTRW